MAVHVKVVEERIAQRHKGEKAIARKEQTERAMLLASWRNAAVPPDERLPVCYFAIHARMWIPPPSTWHAHRLQNGGLPR